ncbi:MAG: hypothetical protein ACMXYM_02380 [Candidatus Woesearchaeota archaeon]
MDLSSMIGSVASTFSALGEFVRANAVLVLIYSAIAALLTRLVTKTLDEFTTRGVAAAEFFRFAEKKR